MLKSIEPLWQTLRSLKGNQRALVVMEPLWSVPNKLFAPFASVYMVAIGLTGQQVGTTISVALAMQLVWALLSGAITDKFGRRRTMLVFGVLSWTVPCLLWATAHSYGDFLVAVIFNSLWQVTGNCFACIIVEDGAASSLVRVWTLINLTGLVSGFLAPVAGIFMARFTLVPTMRAIYFIAMGMMTLRFVGQYYLSQESSTGQRRIEESAGQSVIALTVKGWPVVTSALRNRRLLWCVLLMALLSSFNTVQTTFWPLFVTRADHVDPAMLSVFPMVSSFITLPLYLFVVPRITMRSIRSPLFMGLGLHAIGVAVLLVLDPRPGTLLAIVFLSAVWEALALAMVGPLTESLMSVVVPSAERARINSFVVALMLFISTPVGWLAGTLFQVGRAMPLVLNVGLLIMAAIVSWFVAQVVTPTSTSA